MSARLLLGATLLAVMQICLPGCFLRPDSVSDTLVNPPHVSVEWEGEGDERPFSISAVTLPAGHEGFDEALRQAGAGLRVCGSRPGLSIRHAALTEQALLPLLRGLGLDEDDFSQERSFHWNDKVTVDSRRDGRLKTGAVVYLVPFFNTSVGIGLDVGAVVRPADGALYPVLRGQIALDGPGPVLIVGEAGDRRIFALLVRLDVPGTPRTSEGPTTTPVSHRLEALPFECDSDILSASLDRISLDPGGSTGGCAVHRIPGTEWNDVRVALEQAGSPGEVTVRVLASGSRVRLPLGETELSIGTLFSPGNYTYRSTMAVLNRPGAGPLTETHGENEGLLVLLWDSSGPGRSVAALLRIKPVE